MPLLRPHRRPGTKRKPFYPRQECATLSVALSLPLSLASLFFLPSALRAGLSRSPHSSETMDGTGVLLPQHEMISPSPDLMCTFKTNVSVCVCVWREMSRTTRPTPPALWLWNFCWETTCLCLAGLHPAYTATHTHTFPALKSTLPLATGASL